MMVIFTAHAGETPEQQSCIDLGKRDSDGSSSDRFMREWCQRNAPSKPAALEKPDAASVAPSRNDTPIYQPDDGAEQFNSSRFPPGYHCHMVKFGERICHGGLD
jgi:hypothetical protein